MANKLNPLNISANKRIFARLQVGDAQAVTDVVTRAVQNGCNAIAVPNSVPEAQYAAVQAAAEGLKVFRVNYQGIGSEEEQQARNDIFYRDRPKRDSRRPSGNRRATSGVKQRDPSRKKAHKNKRSIAEQQARKKARAEQDRARCKGGKTDKS